MSEYINHQLFSQGLLLKYDFGIIHYKDIFKINAKENLYIEWWFYV